MRKAILLTAALLAFGAIESHAYVKPERRDMKPITQAMVEHLELTAPAASDTALLLSGDAGDTDGSGATVTSFLADVGDAASGTAEAECRVLTVTPGATTADVAAGNVVITGTNFFGETITDTLAIAENQSTATDGAKAFCGSLTSVVFPAEASPYTATWDLGTLDKIGLHRCLEQAGDVFHAVLGGTKETTDPTCTADADEVEKNFCDLNSALDGSRVDIYFRQNFRCLGQ